MPAYRDAEDLGQLAGWYALTPDGRPLIGPVPGIEGLWVVAGFNGHGFKLAPSIGEGVARMLRDERAGTFDEASASLERFAGAAADAAGHDFGL